MLLIWMQKTYTGRGHLLDLVASAIGLRSGITSSLLHIDAMMHHADAGDAFYLFHTPSIHLNITRVYHIFCVRLLIKNSLVDEN